MPQPRPISFDPEFGVSRARGQSLARFVNVYMEPGAGKGMWSFVGYPGYVLHAQLNGVIRGALMVPRNDIVGRSMDRFYVVAGTALYLVAADGTTTQLGPVPGIDLVEMDYNRFQVAVLAETRLFVFNTQTSQFTEVLDPDFGGGSSITTVNGFGIVTTPGSDKFAITAIDDYTALDALDFAVAESRPDGLVAARATDTELCLMGRTGFEVWPNTGAADFPFERRDVNPDIGCVSRNACKLFGGSLVWLATSTSGGYFVARMVGYEAQRISTHAIERAIESSARPEDAVGYTWDLEGHQMYTLTLDVGSWTHDLTTGLWHQTTTGTAPLESDPEPARFTCQAFVGGSNIFGDRQGRLSRMTFDSYADLDSPLVRRIVSPPIGAPGRRTALCRIDLDVDVGVGNLELNPQILLSISRDGGNTFGPHRSRAIGKSGVYTSRARWGQSGTARSHMLSFTMTDDAPFRGSGGSVEIEMTDAP